MRPIDADAFDKELEKYGEAFYDAEFYTIENIRSMLEDAPTVNPYEWISVNDRLPEIETSNLKRGNHHYSKSVRVLCSCRQKSGKIMVKEGYYETTSFDATPYWRIPGSIDSVTHWMPLPTPPTEKEN